MSDRFGVDVALSSTATPTGDWPILSGPDNLREAQERRAVSNPGALLHRPQYGGGLEVAVGTPFRPDRAATTAQRIRSAALRDPRVSDVRVEVSELGAGMVQVALTVHPIDQSAPQQITIEV